MVDTKDKQTLSVEDVEFLQAVRRIESNPEEFDVGEDGLATTSALRRLLEDGMDTIGDWSRGMVTYRMSPPENSDGGRGWGVESGFGLVRLHDPELTTDGWTPRKIELTEKGEERLRKAERRLDIPHTGSSESASEHGDETLRELRSRVSELERENEQLRETVAELDDTLTEIVESDTGALSADVSDQIHNLSTQAIVQKRLSDEVLEINTDRLHPDNDPLEPEDIRAARNEFWTTLTGRE